MTAYYEEYSKVLVSVDCVVFGFEDNKIKVLIGKRKMNPGKGEKSLYGGFVKEQESLDEAVSRVLYELTGLKNVYTEQVGTFGAINRDPGQRVISVAYCALIDIYSYYYDQLVKYDLEWVDLDDIPQLYSDHNKMVDKAVELLRRKVVHDPLVFHLLPKEFTLTQMQKTYEAIWQRPLDKRNFRKRVKDIASIQPTGNIDRLSSKRGAALYKFCPRLYKAGTPFKIA
ncbi:MAG: NUDIX domain-containing protein [Prevotella sp.]|jgi:hypothetical protein|nr:NUDIX domain-containing protein [Prevotella sp.]